MSRAKRKPAVHAGFGNLLDAWTAPPGAGDPVGCVATSFTFSPAFFEEECLCRFLSVESEPTQDSCAYIIEREEKLAQAHCAALVDQHHCRGARSLRWDLLPARVVGGLLHAKIALLHWSERVRLIVASANLTEDGYRRNQEVFGVLDYHMGSASPRVCLEAFVGFLEEAARSTHVRASPAVERWETFLKRVRGIPQDWGLGPDRRPRGLRVHPLLVGPDHVDQFTSMLKIWPGRSPPVTAHVVSPFFNPPGVPNSPARKLWASLRQRGVAEAHWYVSVEEVPGEERLHVHAPESLLKAQPADRDTARTCLHALDLDQSRPLHAKGISWQNPTWTMYCVGSSNFTSAGMGLAKNPNLEANLAYVLNHEKYPGVARALKRAFPASHKLQEKTPLCWMPLQAAGEDEPGAELILPREFGSVVYSARGGVEGRLRLSFIGRPPSGWTLSNENDQPLLTETEWQAAGAPQVQILHWQDKRPPSELRVRWDGTLGSAWWPVEVESGTALPPPEELRNLPLEVLVAVLTSARPLHRVIDTYVRHRKNLAREGADHAKLIDPLKQVDTSRFLLQRTRRVARALNLLRERLERPAATRESLAWRLRGPVGALAMADALVREARSKAEQQFLLAEFVLELSRTCPRGARGYLSPAEVRGEIVKLISEIEVKLVRQGLEGPTNLKAYVRAALKARLT